MHQGGLSGIFRYKAKDGDNKISVKRKRKGNISDYCISMKTVKIYKDEIESRSHSK